MAAAPRLTIALAVLFLLALGVSVALREGLLAGGALVRETERGRIAAPQLLVLQDARWQLLQQSLLLGLGWLTLLAGWLGLARRLRWPGGALAAGLAVLALLDVLIVAHQFHHPEPRRAPREEIPVPGAVRYLEAQTPPFRILPVGALFGSNAFGFAKLESIGGYQPAKLRAYQDLLDDGAITAMGILRALDVRYVVAEAPLEMAGLVHQEDGYVYELPAPPGRAWSVERATQIREADAVVGRMRRSDFDPATEALFTPDQAPSATTYRPARIAIAERTPEKLTLAVDADGPALVVVSEIWYPPGRRAQLDGSPVRLLRADHVLQAVEVPAGAHRLELWTGSTARERGIVLARVGAGIALLLSAAGWWRQRRASRSASAPITPAAS